MGVPLYVPLPRCPDLNGSVERGNRTLRAEFWSVHHSELTIKAVNEALGGYLEDYHNVRPH